MTEDDPKFKSGLVLHPAELTVNHYWYVNSTTLIAYGVHFLLTRIQQNATVRREHFRIHLEGDQIQTLQIAALLP
jgi:hypothetical protein